MDRSTRCGPPPRHPCRGRTRPAHTDKIPFTRLFTALQSGQYAMSWFKLQSGQPWDFIQSELAKGAAWNPAKDFDLKLNSMVDKAQKARERHRPPRSARSTPTSRTTPSTRPGMCWTPSRATPRRSK
ncbi:hypothetical protein KN815_04530 [Streptomyces sp. 4503]|uniref:Uncharacterized protein n=1 Tax=Streptomyces niphimycinicus TaxID=2842201 RepID=A0ABS6C904_9ACTN|nr:hypothetical protein [Streptomyces niphimycinicus]MBU3863378.1 hypothetical protein [Streptomyces niphimycinicus]